MIEVSLDFFYRKIRLEAELANWFFYIFCLTESAAIAKVYLLFRNLLKTITSEMKTGIAAVTVENLIRIVI